MVRLGQRGLAVQNKMVLKQVLSLLCALGGGAGSEGTGWAGMGDRAMLYLLMGTPVSLAGLSERN